MARADKMKLGTFVYTFGFHPASWLHPASDVNGANDFAHLLDVAKRSEAAKFDFMFMADSPPLPSATRMRLPAFPQR